MISYWTKFKHPHTKISKKGIKGLKNVTNILKIMFQSQTILLVTPNLTETIRRILAKRKIRAFNGVIFLIIFIC
jgi:uncharacterized membrane protein